jgi:hypothetical protein
VGVFIEDLNGLVGLGGGQIAARDKGEPVLALVGHIADGLAGCALSGDELGAIELDVGDHPQRCHQIVLIIEETGEEIRAEG